MTITSQDVEHIVEQAIKTSLSAANAARQVSDELLLLLIARLLEKRVMDRDDIAAMVDRAQAQRTRSASIPEQACAAEVIGRNAHIRWLDELIEELRELERQAASRSG